MGDRGLTGAMRWLTHPVSLVAMAVMALNDHVLKQRVGSWWTGKLSDVTGLIFFPALVALALAAARAVMARTRRRVTSATSDGLACAPSPGLACAPRRGLVSAAIAVTGVGFAWVKCTQVGADAASAILSLLAGSSLVRADATDLLALPALALAAWVGLGRGLVPAAWKRVIPCLMPDASRSRAGRSRKAVREHRPAARTRVARLSLGIVAVPAAVLVSVATSAAEDPFANVVVDASGEARAFVSQMSTYPDPLTYAWANRGWVEVPTPPGGPEEYEFALHVPNQRQACVPGQERICYRAIPEAMGVARSDDAGESWRVDWQLSQAEIEELGSAYGKATADLWTQGLGVVPTDQGYVVIAGNGVDGFAVRHEDGTWERLGFAGLECCSWARMAVLGTVAGLPEQHALPVGLVMAFAVATLALPWVALGVGRGRVWQEFGRSSAAAGAFWVFYVFGALLGGGMVVMNSHYGPLVHVAAVGDAPMLVFFGGIAVLMIVGSSAAARFFSVRVGRWALIGWVLGAVAAGWASSLVPHGLLLQVLVALTAAGAVYAVYVPLARRVWLRGGGG